VLDAGTATRLGATRTRRRLAAGDFDLQEYTLEARHYQTLGRLGVLATRARIGTIDGAGRRTLLDTPIPATGSAARCRSSSATSWAARTACAAGALRGVDLSGSACRSAAQHARDVRRVRAPLFGKITACCSSTRQRRVRAVGHRAQGLRYDVGPGLRYLTPIGPDSRRLRLPAQSDSGLLVDGVPESRRWRIHFSLGQAF
jgi:hypothetical protein